MDAQVNQIVDRIVAARLDPVPSAEVQASADERLIIEAFVSLTPAERLALVERLAKENSPLLATGTAS